MRNYEKNNEKTMRIMRKQYTSQSNVGGELDQESVLWFIAASKNEKQ